MRRIIPIVVALTLSGAAYAAEPQPAPSARSGEAEAAWVKWKPKHAWKGNRGRHLGWYRGHHRGWYR